MGAYERCNWISVPPKCLDKTRYISPLLTNSYHRFRTDLAHLLPGAASFIASASKHLPATDVWCILYPSLRPLLRSDIQSISEHSLLLTLKPPVSDMLFFWKVIREHSLFLIQSAVKTNVRRSRRLGYASQRYALLGSL